MADKAKAPAGRAGMTQVEINACWVEAVRKESKGRILNEQFDFNPKNCKSQTSALQAICLAIPATVVTEISKSGDLPLSSFL